MSEISCYFSYHIKTVFLVKMWVSCTLQMISLFMITLMQIMSIKIVMSILMTMMTMVLTLMLQWYHYYLWHDNNDIIIKTNSIKYTNISNTVFNDVHCANTSNTENFIADANDSNSIDVNGKENCHKFHSNFQYSNMNRQYIYIYIYR